MQIALLSDIHYGRCAVSEEFTFEGEPLDIPQTGRAQPLLDGMINILKEHSPDYLLVAGDLTSSGSPLEFKHCSELLMKIGNELSIQEKNILVCLGNHDADWHISDLANSYKHIGDYRSEDASFLRDYYRELSYIYPEKGEMHKAMLSTTVSRFELPLSYVLERESCIFFVLNSSHLSTRDQKYKHGALQQEQFQWFKKEAEKYTDSEKLKILMLHHHPFNYANQFSDHDISLLEEGGDVVEICGRTGIDIVIHGHRHQPQAMTYKTNTRRKPITFICAGSLSVNNRERADGIPNTFHVIDYQDPGRIKLKSYLYGACDGWNAVTYSRKTPIDGEMLLGKLISEEEAKALIAQLLCGKLSAAAEIRLSAA